MKTLEALACLLKDRRIDHVADATGLSRITIASVRDGKQKNPSYETMKRLSDYFEAREAEVNGSN